MKRWILVLVMVMAVAPWARADEASKRAKVQDLFVVMKMDSMMDQLTKSIMQQVQQGMDGVIKPDYTPEQKKVVQDYQERMYQLVMSAMGWKAIEPEYVEMYANTYTEEEIDGILAFYKSSAGQAMLAKTPQLMTKGTALSQEKMQELQPKMRDMIEDMVREMSKGLPPKPSGAPRTQN